jgi:hypothetical protein
VARNARRSLDPGRRGAVLVDRLERELEAAEEVLAQTELRLKGQRTIPDRRVSLVDPDAGPIRRGNPRQPTEFGFKAKVADTAEGFVIAEVPERGNPADDALLEGAIEKAKAAGMQVRTVLADRGFGTPTGDAALARQGVRDAVIPPPTRAGSGRAERLLEAPLPLPKRPRGSHLPPQPQRAQPHPLTRPARGSDGGPAVRLAGTGASVEVDVVITSRASTLTGWPE